MMGFAEPVIGPAPSGQARWLYPSYGLKRRRSKTMGFTSFSRSYGLQPQATQAGAPKFEPPEKTPEEIAIEWVEQAWDKS